MNSPQPDPWIGRLIGDRQRYRLERRLDKGGMGDVFLAMDTLLGQQVALKLLKETLAAAGELRKRFEREVALCAALRSDHIVQVSDYGVTSEGHPFYVMEYLVGQTLGQLLRREKRLSVERTVSLITQVCEGLHRAHAGVKLWRSNATSSEHIKVVHRDLKPANIFLVTTALGELVKILDFGIAKKIYDDQAERTRLTNTFLGTFHYAAPEQLGIEKDLDGRADIYSLGIILYEMLSGTDPFGFGPRVYKTTEISWARAHMSKQPQPLRAQAGCENLSPELEAVVIKCLQKSPNERFASVDELNRALQAAQSGFRDTASQLQTFSEHSDESTIYRPLASALGADATMVQTPSFEPGDDKTIFRPLPPSRQESDLTIIQPLPSPESSSPNSMVSPLASEPEADATTAQTPPSSQQRTDATIAQVPSSPSRGIPDRTIAQVPPSPSQENPEATIVQVPSSPSQDVADTTIIQPLFSPGQAPNKGTDATIVQVPFSPGNQVPDATVVQVPSKSEPEVEDTGVSLPRNASDQSILKPTVAEIPISEQSSRSHPRHNLLPLWMGLVIGFLLMGLIYAYMQFQSHNQGSDNTELKR